MYRSKPYPASKVWCDVCHTTWMLYGMDTSNPDMWLSGYGQSCGLGTISKLVLRA